MSKIKRNILSENLWDYNIGLLGEAGIGKTTLMTQVCDKLVGADGYVVFNMGKEDGVSCLQNVPYVDIPNWKEFDEITKDIIENKDTEYKNLKIILTDTLDQFIEISEPEAVHRWNVENRNKKDFSQVKTINASWGGFGRGEDKVSEIILNRMWELKKIGVAFWFCGHTKTRDVVDPVTSASYTTLTTNMTQKYFNSFKTKFHVIGIACINREIAKEKTGRKNLVNRQDITINKVKSETREIVFRDDNYSIDSKSRFAEIVDRVPMNADDFIEALQSAIKKEKAKGKVHNTEVTPVQDIELGITDNDETNLEPITETISYPDNISDIVKEKFLHCQNTDIKKQATQIIKSYGKFTDVDRSGLCKLYDLLV